jgi:hypothetical protein
MTTKTPEKKSRDVDADLPQVYRLICMNRTGRKSGRRASEKSAPLSGTAGEKRSGLRRGLRPPESGKKPEHPGLQEPGARSSGTPAGSGDPGAAGSAEDTLRSPALPGDAGISGKIRNPVLPKDPDLPGPTDAGIRSPAGLDAREIAELPGPSDNGQPGNQAGGKNPGSQCTQKSSAETGGNLP